jgi:hypothetical protein
MDATWLTYIVVIIAALPGIVGILADTRKERKLPDSADQEGRLSPPKPQTAKESPDGDSSSNQQSSEKASVDGKDDSNPETIAHSADGADVVEKPSPGKYTTRLGWSLLSVLVIGVVVNMTLARVNQQKAAADRGRAEHQDRVQDRNIRQQTQLIAQQQHVMASQKDLTTAQQQMISSQKQFAEEQQKLISSQKLLTKSQEIVIASQDDLTVSQRGVIESQRSLTTSQDALNKSQHGVIDAQASQLAHIQASLLNEVSLDELEVTLFLDQKRILDALAPLDETDVTDDVVSTVQDGGVISYDADRLTIGPIGDLEQFFDVTDATMVARFNTAVAKLCSQLVLVRIANRDGTVPVVRYRALQPDQTEVLIGQDSVRLKFKRVTIRLGLINEAPVEVRVDHDDRSLLPTAIMLNSETTYVHLDDTFKPEWIERSYEVREGRDVPLSVTVYVSKPHVLHPKIKNLFPGK